MSIRLASSSRQIHRIAALPFAIATLFSTAVRLAPSENTVSTTVGFMQQLSALGQFLGPPLVAWVAVLVGGWQWTWVVTVSLSLIGLWLAQRIGAALLALQNE